jgi:hypothetical protein
LAQQSIQITKEKEGESVIKIIVQKDSPRYQVVDEGSYLIELSQLDSNEFLTLTDDTNFNGLIDKYGVKI